MFEVCINFVVGHQTAVIVDTASHNTTNTLALVMAPYAIEADCYHLSCAYISMMVVGAQCLAPFRSWPRARALVYFSSQSLSECKLIEGRTNEGTDTLITAATSDSGTTHNIDTTRERYDSSLIHITRRRTLTINPFVLAQLPASPIQLAHTCRHCDTTHDTLFRSASFSWTTRLSRATTSSRIID